jgi:cold shock CspA family protein
MQASATRFNGTLKKWNAERGFGFVAAEHGGQELFLHVSAMPRDGWIPVVGEPLSFEIELVKDGRKRAVRVRRPGVLVAAATSKASHAEQARHQTRRPAQRATSSCAGIGFVALLLAAGLGWYAYGQYTNRAEALRAPPPQGLMSANPAAPKPQIQQQPAFHCDGRQYCSQVTSCREAKLFLKNCPGMEMNGDGNGVPCEQQWCTESFGG